MVPRIDKMLFPYIKKINPQIIVCVFISLLYDLLDYFSLKKAALYKKNQIGRCITALL